MQCFFSHWEPLTQLEWFNELVNVIGRKQVTSLMANSEFGICFSWFSHPIHCVLASCQQLEVFLENVSLKCPLTCFIVIWFLLFVLRFRGNRFPLLDGLCYEDVHYCLVLTNKILQKLVINVMGRSEHATWVITLDPTCLMVCYAEQRATGSLPREKKGKKLRD